MKKLFIMALAAIFAANISAQEAKSEKAAKAEVKAEKAECKKDHKECKMSTFREYRKAQFELKKQFKQKFAKDLNDRQVKRVLHFREGHPCKGDGHFKGEGPRKHEIKK